MHIIKGSEFLFVFNGSFLTKMNFVKRLFDPRNKWHDSWLRTSWQLIAVEWWTVSASILKLSIFFIELMMTLRSNLLSFFRVNTILPLSGEKEERPSFCCSFCLTSFQLLSFVGFSLQENLNFCLRFSFLTSFQK